jgi:hypothetical protein
VPPGFGQHYYCAMDRLVEPYFPCIRHKLAATRYAARADSKRNLRDSIRKTWSTAASPRAIPVQWVPKNS